MMEESSTGGRSSWKVISITVFLASLVLTAVAGVTGFWVLTAVPIGFLFGVFLEKSDLCGASAFSEIVLMRDARKVWGLWVAIAVSMAAFALGSALGWIDLSPKPFLWAKALVGGVVFGVGIVLAGGCVSGALFKSGQGNLNSMAALVGIPIGIAAVAYGPLASLNAYLKQYALAADDGTALTLADVVGLPYWLLALIIPIATLLIAWGWARRRRGDRSGAGEAGAGAVVRRGWKPWQSGIAIGLLGLLAYASSAASGRNYPLGATHGVLDVLVLLTDTSIDSVWKRKAVKVAATAPAGETGSPAEPVPGSPRPGPKPKRIEWWLVGLVLAMVVGSHLSSRMRGSFQFRPKPPDETLIAFGGGLLTGAGAALGSGCVIGHILSGIALLSMSSLLFAVTVVLASWGTTYLYLVGPGALSSGGRHGERE